MRSRAMESDITPMMDQSEFDQIKTWATGYITGLVDRDVFHDGWDEWYAYNKNWDINFYSNGEPDVVHVVAYPYLKHRLETDTSQWLHIANFNYKGKELPMKETE
jgi:hypothetical protein